MGLFDLELWEKYKRGLPASITQGETDPSRITMVPDSPGTKLFHGAMDTLDAIRGEPASSREGLERRGIWDHTIGVAGDVSAIAQGKMMPIQAEPIVGEPGTYEKIMGPIADFSSIIHGRGLPSRKAALARDKLQLEEEELRAGERDKEISTINAGLKMFEEVAGRVWELPPEIAEEKFLDLADIYEASGQPLLAYAARQEAEFPGTNPTNYNEMIEFAPHLEYTFNTGGLLALAEATKQEETGKMLVQGADNKAIGIVNEWYEGMAKPWAEEHAPEMVEGIEGDKRVTLPEFYKYLDALPETILPFKARGPMKSLAKRNPEALGIEPPKVTEAGETQFAQKRAERAAAEAAGPHFVTTTDEHGRTVQTNVLTGEKKFTDKPAKAATTRGLFRVDMPDGSFETVHSMNDGTYKAGDGTEFIPPSGSTFTKVGTGRGGLSKDAASNLGDASMMLSDLVELRGRMQPGVVGWRGGLSQKLGGLVESAPFVGGAASGKGVTEFVSGVGLVGGGATQEEVIKYRQTARAISISMREYFTGEGGVRISENERKEALESAALLNTTTSLTQADASSRHLMKLYLKSELKKGLAAGKPLYDMTKAEDVDAALLFITEDLGITEDEADEWIGEYVRQQRISESLRRVR